MNNIGLGERALKWAVRMLLIISSILVIFPVVWLLMSSFKNQMEFLADPMALPTVWRFSNYVTAFLEMDIYKYLFNSIILVVGTAVIYFLMLSTTSYIIAKYRCRLSRAMEILFFFGMLVPAVLRLTSMYFMFDDMGMTDRHITLMLIYSANALPGGVFLIATFMRSINNAFIEAAVIDGATEFQIFRNVIIPMAKPILFFSLLTNVIGTWNEYTTALTFISSPSKYPLSIGLHFMEASTGDKGIVFAGLVITLIPVFIVYGLFQKQIQEGVSADAGVKG